MYYVQNEVCSSRVRVLTVHLLYIFIMVRHIKKANIYITTFSYDFFKHNLKENIIIITLNKLLNMMYCRI